MNIYEDDRIEYDEASVDFHRGEDAMISVFRKDGPTGIIHMPGGQAQNRREADFYPTPRKLCDAAVRIIRDEHLCFNEDGVVLDPGSGDGPWGQAIRSAYPNTTVVGGDIRSDAPRPEGYDVWFESWDFLSDYNLASVDAIVGNPPYKFAEEFIRRSYDLLRPGCPMIQLLRLAFLEGQARGLGMWKAIPPQSVYVCSARPSFMPEGHAKAGKTDATAYAVYVWTKGWTGSTELKWLDWK